MYEDRYYEESHKYLSAQLDEPNDDEIHLAKSTRNIVWDGRPGKPRFLDVGCGGGRLVMAFLKAGWIVMGIDPSRKAIQAGLKRGLDLRTIELNSPTLGKFDLISASHTVEHVYSPKKFLQQCANHLSSGGFILLEVPDYGSRSARKMRENWACLYPQVHLYQFTTDTLYRYLRESGFKIVQLRKLGGRGPLEQRRATYQWSKNSHQLDVKSVLFELRRLLYWSPALKRVLRYLVWHTLGYGEFIRVLAQKEKHTNR